MNWALLPPGVRGKASTGSRVLNVIRGGCGDFLLRQFAGRCLRRSVNVVYYHYVGQPAPHYAPFFTGCTAERFQEEIKDLSRIFDFVPLSEALSEAAAQSLRRRPLMAVTFDDGLDLRPTGAMEVLDRFRIKATSFVMTAGIGNQMLMWRYMLAFIQGCVPDGVWRAQYIEMAATQRLSPLAANQSLLDASYGWDMQRKDEWAAELWTRCGLRPLTEYLSETKPYFDWAGLEGWLGAGHSVGFHTNTHPFCSRLAASDIEDELIRPAAQLKQRMGLKELYFSYPFGCRFAAKFEEELLDKGIFQALFGISGFSPGERSKAHLDRLSIESSSVRKRLLSESVRMVRRAPWMPEPYWLPT